MAWLLGTSLALQLATAAYALRLIRITGRRSAWVLIACAITLMAVRRGVTLSGVLAGTAVKADYTAEGVALCISVLMLCGVVMIGTTFRELRQRHRRRLEQQVELARAEREVLERQRLESLGLMASGIAHDFNNLLTVILGYASLGRAEQVDDPATLEMFRSIEDAARRASGLARQLLAYAGNAPHAVEGRDLCQLVEGMRDFLHASLPGGVHLDLTLAPGPLTVRADRVQLEQIVVNLVLNAAEALEGREGRIRVAVGPFAIQGDWLAEALHPTSCAPGPGVRLAVEDTGPGIPAAAQQRMFDPFFSTKGQGRGLGLSAVLGIVRSQGGAIAVDSAPGRGTRFEIVFPRVADAVASPAPTGDTTEPRARRGLRVLVVDDESALRTFVGRALERAGMQVVTAADGFEGLEACGRPGEQFDLLLVDRTMPRMTGDEFVDRVSRCLPDVPVILMSGYVDPAQIRATASRRIAAFLAKPFTAAELEAAIDEAIRPRRVATAD